MAVRGKLRRARRSGSSRAGHGQGFGMALAYGRELDNESTIAPGCAASAFVAHLVLAGNHIKMKHMRTRIFRRCQLFDPRVLDARAVHLGNL